MDLRQYRTTINTPRLVVRTMEIADGSAEYAAWLNDPVVHRYLDTHTATVADIQTYIKEKLASGWALFFGIFWKGEVSSGSGELHIGTVKLEPIDFEKGVATLGLLIGDKEYWGKGVATEVTQAMVDFAFTTLGLGEVNLGVRPDNAPAIRVYEKCGFTVTKKEDNQIYMVKRK